LKNKQANFTEQDPPRNTKAEFLSFAFFVVLLLMGIPLPHTLGVFSMFSDIAILQTRKTFWLPTVVIRSRSIQTEALSRLHVQPVPHCSRLTIMDYFKRHLHLISG